MLASMVTTDQTLPGYTITRNLGVVRGITMRSRSIVGNFFGSLQTLFGGNITIYTNLCERARSETYQLMCREASALGANAIIAMRYDATELMTGLTEVLCYGTAVMVRRERGMGWRRMADWVGGGLGALLRCPVAAGPTIMF